MTKYILADGIVASNPDPREARAIEVMIVGLCAAVLVSTIIHHHFPHLLNVPSREGIYLSDYPAMLAMDLGVMALAWLCFRHAWRRIGLYAAMTFLAGSFVFTGIEESMWILIGRFATDAPADVPGADGNTLVTNGTYYFTRGFFWFLETPVSACVGWFFLAYSSVYMAEIIIPRARSVFQAALGGALATNVDLWVDPIQTHPHYTSWVWAKLPGGVLVFGIPITNFIGWFLLIFLFALVFRRFPAMVRRFGLYRGTAFFYAILMALEIAILIGFAIYGTIEQALFSPPINLTVWGIGG